MMTQQQKRQHHENLTEGSPKQSNFICWRLRRLIKIRVDVEDILNDGFFRDTVDTPKEGTEQHKK